MFGIYSAKDEKRFLITPRPYGVENSCGVSISFRLRNDLEYSQLCRAGENQFFKFEYAMDAISPFPSSWKSEDNKSGTVMYRMAQQTRPRMKTNNENIDIFVESTNYSDNERNNIISHKANEAV